LCIGTFARYSASPGSLYTYTSTVLPPSLAAAAGWSLLLAYIATGSSVIGGFYHFGNLLLKDATGHGAASALLALLVTALSGWVAWRDVKISARLMLWIEAAFVSLILVLIALVLLRQGWHLDWRQFQLRGMSGSGPRLGLVLALFSFVGFESTTTLGSEARNPLRTIPRAVIQSALLAGPFSSHVPLVPRSCPALRKPNIAEKQAAFAPALLKRKLLASVKAGRFQRLVRSAVLL
jgi:amino acid transporter